MYSASVEGDFFAESPNLVERQGKTIHFRGDSASQRSVDLASSFQRLVLWDDLRAPEQEQSAFLWVHLVQLNKLCILSGSV